jgi:phosphoserine phosphatase
VIDLSERIGIDLERSAAYSDSANDIPLLSLVGQPVAVNPDARLLAHARAQGWQVRDFRTAASRRSSRRPRGGAGGRPGRRRLRRHRRQPRRR